MRPDLNYTNEELAHHYYNSKKGSDKIWEEIKEDYQLLKNVGTFEEYLREFFNPPTKKTFSTTLNTPMDKHLRNNQLGTL